MNNKEFTNDNLQNTDYMSFVSVIIPCRNEEKFISMCLDSIIAQNYPKNKLEVLVIDGMSNDRSPEIVLEYAKHYPFVQFLENPKLIAPTALNIGIREARGEIIVRIDAHATYETNYIDQCVTLLQTTDATNVGGMQRAVGTDYVSNTIAIAITHPFGIGDAKFRYSNREEWVDTVYLGSWYKKSLESLGGFNEEWVVNQDYELNYRLRKSGGKILLSPKICCHYYVRSSLKKLAFQYFRYGFWKVKTIVKHPNSLRWRQLVPPVFVLTLIVSFALVPFFHIYGMVVPGLYVISNLVASFQIASQRGRRYFPLLPFIFVILHISWGIGFLIGLTRFGIPRFSLNLLLRSLADIFHSPKDN